MRNFVVCVVVVAVVVVLCSGGARGQQHTADHELPYGSECPWHSFGSPFYDGKVPNWSLGAGARVEDNAFVRLTPARQSRMGYAWNDVVTTLTDWEVTLTFRATGMPSLGGDGFAMWYTAKGGMMGPVYGGMDYWDGLGIFFDTFNNDGTGDFPLIAAVINDGSLSYDHGTDGASQAIASCQAGYRNLDYYSTVKVTYQYGSLSVAYDLASNGNWVECFSIPSVELGLDKYFGLTAGTGDLADNHDVASFKVRSLMPANVDIEAVRSRFKRAHDHSNMAAGAGSGPRDTDAYQNEVMRMLHQIQSTANLIESSTVAVRNAIEGGRVPPVGSSGSSTPPVGLSPGSERKIDNLHRAIADLSARVNDVVQTVRTNAAGSGSSSGGYSGPPGVDKATLATTVRSELNTALRDIPSSAAISSMISSALATAQPAGGDGGSGGGWMFAIIMLVLGFALGFGVSSYLARSSRNAYKLP